MLRWAVIFLLLAMIAGNLAVTDVASTAAAGLAQVVFIAAYMVFVTTTFVHMRMRHRTKSNA